MLSEQEIADRRIQNRRANIVFITLGLFVLAATLLVVVSPFLPARHVLAVAHKVAPEPTDFDACVMSQVFIKRQLKSPSTADFPACNDSDTVVSREGGNWKVISYVDAQNAFGAMLRADYSTLMTYNASTDRWTLTDFALVNR